MKPHHRKHLIQIGVGYGLYEAWNTIYDYVLYPLGLIYFGILIGGILLFLGSLICVCFLFWLYDYMKVDWLGAHAIRQMENDESKGKIKKIFTWLGSEKKTIWEKIASPIVFILLTAPVDPLIVAIHYRRKHFDGTTFRDWAIVIASIISSNIWWLLKVGIVVEGVKYVIK